MMTESDEEEKAEALMKDAMEITGVALANQRRGIALACAAYLAKTGPYPTQPADVIRVAGKFEAYLRDGRDP